MALALATLAAVVIAGAWFFADDLGLTDEEAVGVQSGPDDDAPADGPEAADQDADADGAAADEAPVDRAETDHVPCPDDVVAEVCDAVFFVETFRGRAFKDFPRVEFQANDEFDTGLLAEFDEDTVDLEVVGEVFRSLGLIDPNDDLVAQLRRSLEAGVVGYYDPETGELVVRGTNLDLYVQSVLVHELAHAFDDQWLDLDRPELDDVDDESDFGFTAVVEGNAMRVENAWRETLSEGEIAELNRLELSVLSPDDIAILQSIPNVVLELQYSPYIDGPELVGRIAAEAGGGEAGEAAVDAAILEPPIASEQVLDPDLFDDGYAVVPVPEPAARGEVIEDGVVGELLFGIWLGERVGDGWGGDRFVTWREGSGRNARVCTAIHVAADSDGDLDEYLEGATVWARNRPDDRVVERVDGASGSPDIVLIEGCN